MYKVQVYNGYTRVELFCKTLHGAKCVARRWMKRLYRSSFTEAYIRKGDALVTFCTQNGEWWQMPE